MNRPLPNPLALAATRIPACVDTADKFPVTARGLGKHGEEDNAIKHLRPAFEHHARMFEGESSSDLMTDSSFARFRDSEKFRKAVLELEDSK